MTHPSRELWDAVVRALAKVGLVWALAVLGALFVLTSAQAPELASAAEGQSPRTLGMALALLVLAGGVGVLAVGALRGDEEPAQPVVEDDAAGDLPLAVGLSLLP